MPVTKEPIVLVVMGVSGTGKSTVGENLQKRLHWAFQEGDSLHSPEAVAKMHAGIPLTDEDRWPWLHRIADVIDGWLQNGQSGIVSCSALKRAYRDVVIGGRPQVRLVYLHGTREVLSQRMAARREHYMPVSLLDSQLAILEPPGPDEHPINVDVALSSEQIVEKVLAALRLN